MLSSRYLASAAIGLFSLFLALFALTQKPRKPAAVYFALHNLSVAAWFLLVGPFSMFPNHSVALLLYRGIQIALPIHCYFLICFIQELSGSFQSLDSKRIRKTALLLIVLWAPFYLSPWIIQDFALTSSGTDMVFRRVPGPLYLPNFFVFLFLFLTAAVTTFKNLRQASGIRRNQLRFVALGVGFGICSVIGLIISFVRPGTAWLTFGPHVMMVICFSYAIFKYDLLDFDLWIKRLSTGAGIYIALMSIPLFLYYPFRDKLLAMGDSLWNFLAGVTIGFGFLFSLVPTFVSYLRDRSEQKRWADLRHSLEFVKEAAEKLAGETHSFKDLSARLVEVLRQFYWERMKTPLKFVAVVLKTESELSTEIFPSHKIDDGILLKFLASLRTLPVDMIHEPFSSYDLERRVAVETGSPAALALENIIQYLRSNEVELCCPCVHDGKINGVILLGGKSKGVFWPEELSTLRLTAAHGATAVRKSELLVFNRELKDLDRMKTEFISNITHEFKTPLHVVETAVDTLLDDIRAGRLNTSKASDYLLMVKNNAGQLGLFIQNLLILARIEQARVDLQKEEEDLNRVAAKAVDLMRPLADKKGIELALVPMPSVSIDIDVDKMAQVFCNLISNAIKFTDSGRVQVKLERLNGKALVRVSDTGLGIEPEHLASVFEKFFQAPLSKDSNPNGTGLGLTIAKGWVEAHGGRIWAESAGPGQGATFIVELPVSTKPE